MSYRYWIALFLWAISAYQCSPTALAQSNAPSDSSDQTSLAQAGDEAPMRLRLKNNGFGVGKIVPGTTDSVIGWQNVGFSEPFFFDVASVRSISTLQAAEAIAAPDKSLFLIESTDGQSLTGQIVGLDENTLTVKSSIFGEIVLPIPTVNQLIRADYSGEVVYSGLSQSGAWTPLGQVRDWDIRAGILTATKQGAAILGDLKLPSKCEVVISLSWRGVPDFVVSLGAGAAERNAGQVISTARLEVWNRNIVLVRETDKDADLKRLSELNEKNPQIELRILMDQENGLVVVQDVHGRMLGKLQVAESASRIGPAIHIVNHGPSLSVERLEVRQWNGSSMLGKNENSQVALANERILENSWLSRLDVAKGQFEVESLDGTASSVSIDDVVAAGLHPKASRIEESTKDQPNTEKDSGTVNESRTEGKTADASEAAVIEDIEVIFADRSRLKGEWNATQNGKLVLFSQWCKKELAFPVEQIIGVIGTEGRFAPDLTAHRNGVVKIGDTELPGFLVEDVPDSQERTLRWQPHGSDASSPFLSNAEGSIAYRVQLPVSASGQPTGRLDELLSQRGDAPAEQNNKSNAPNEQPDPSNKELATTAQVTREIVFASGDTIDGYIERADEKGVYFLSHQTQVRFVEHSKLDRAWLNSMAASVKKTADEKIERLMTVPRARKDDPPTQLLISTNGDFLRGRLIQVNDREVQMDVRSKVAVIPREKIAQIVWLHQRKWNKTEEETAKVETEYSVHVIQQERGLTFSPTRSIAGTIHGKSELLGPSEINIKQITQILFGPNLSERVSKFRENPWVLSLAQLPRAYLENESKSNSGSESLLVGKPAPGFRLSQLDGQQLRLSEMEGKIVVLDFWASWCGPCIKTLPVVHRVVSEFKPDEVQLVAINIQESESRVKAAMEKLAIPNNVVLDLDGDVAASYEARAIPQTVVIDHSGIVRFIFVGSRSELASELKDAINQLLSGKAG